MTEFLQTVMSTDIIKYSPNDQGTLIRQFSLGCLEIYLYCTIPLMVVTLSASWLFRLWENRRSYPRYSKETLFDTGP